MSGGLGRPQAILALPAGSGGRISDPRQRRWLAKGRLAFDAPFREQFLQVLAALGQPAPTNGLGALRLWGQTGRRPDTRIAAADPVYLEAMLNHVRLHALAADQLPQLQLARVFGGLQREFGDDAELAFAHVGSCGYLRGAGTVASAAVSAQFLHLAEPTDFLPAGDAAGSHDQLIGELQMYLHAHPVNEERRRTGLLPINSLWIWGGGEPPAPERRELPALFADDPLYTGYWLSSGGQAAPWPASLEICLQSSPAGFVGVCPAIVGATACTELRDLLESLRRMLSRGELHRVTLMFRDGLTAELQRRDALKFWRRVPQSLAGAASA